MKNLIPALILLVTLASNASAWADTGCALAERWDKDRNLCVFDGGIVDADYAGVYNVQQANARYDALNHVRN